MYCLTQNKKGHNFPTPERKVIYEKVSHRAFCHLMHVNVIVIPKRLKNITAAKTFVALGCILDFESMTDLVKMNCIRWIIEDLANNLN